MYFGFRPLTLAVTAWGISSSSSALVSFAQHDFQTAAIYSAITIASGGFGFIAQKGYIGMHSDTASQTSTSLPSTESEDSTVETDDIDTGDIGMGGRVRESDRSAVRRDLRLDDCQHLADGVGGAGSIATRICQAKFVNSTSMEDSAVRWDGSSVTLNIPDAHGKRSSTFLRVVAQRSESTVSLNLEDIRQITSEIDNALIAQTGSMSDACVRVRIQKPSSNSKSTRSKVPDSEEVIMRLQYGQDGDGQAFDIAPCMTTKYT